MNGIPLPWQAWQRMPCDPEVGSETGGWCINMGIHPMPQGDHLGWGFPVPPMKNGRALPRCSWLNGLFSVIFVWVALCDPPKQKWYGQRPWDSCGMFSRVLCCGMLPKDFQECFLRLSDCHLAAYNFPHDMSISSVSVQCAVFQNHELHHSFTIRLNLPKTFLKKD